MGIETVTLNDVDIAWDTYLGRADVQKAIHALPPHGGGAWRQCGGIGYHTTWPSSLVDYSAAFSAGLRVLVWSGDADATTCPFSSTQVAVMALSQLPGANITENWKPFLVNGQTAGYIEHHGNAFSFATVRGAGHEAPGFQPYASFELVSNFINGTVDSLTSAKPRVSPRKSSRKGETQGSTLNRIVREAQESLRKEKMKRM